MRNAIEASISSHMTQLGVSISALTSEIADLKQSLLQKDNHIEELSQRIVVLESRPNTRSDATRVLEERVNQLEGDLESLEQYGRRMNIRVENVPLLAQETPASLETQVLGLLQEAGAAIEPRDVTRLHRSSALRMRDGATSKSSQVIVRLSNWKARESAHLARHTARTQGHLIRQDLTATRREIIAEAQTAIRGWPARPGDLTYCYANINCGVVMRRGPTVRSINNPADLAMALDFFRPT